jgi:hypothetical protein
MTNLDSQENQKQTGGRTRWSHSSMSADIYTEIF